MPLLPPIALLLIDDKTDARDYAVRVLQEAGYVALTATDAATALRMLEGGGIEALIVFTGVPHSDLAREAKALNRGLKVAFVPWLYEAARTISPMGAASRLLRELHPLAASPADATSRSIRAF